MLVGKVRGARVAGHLALDFLPKVEARMHDTAKTSLIWTNYWTLSTYS